MRSVTVQILSGPDTSTQTGAAFWVGQICSASFVPIFGDVTAAGTVKIQASNDIPPSGTVAVKYTPASTSWADIPSATSTIASGVGPAIVIDNMCFAYIRAVYTKVSGGTTTVTVNMNQIGV